jgi:hypothetical protein
LEGSPGQAQGLGAGVPGIAWDRLALLYRAHCEAVGLDRARLFEKKANKLRLWAHDMRAFFITSGMFAGRDALWITDRSGHTTLAMLRTDGRDVRRWRELGEVPAPADTAIPELPDTNVSANMSAEPATPEVDEVVTSREYIAKAEVAEWQTQRTQNPPSERA